MCWRPRRRPRRRRGGATPRARPEGPGQLLHLSRIDPPRGSSNDRSESASLPRPGADSRLPPWGVRVRPAGHVLPRRGDRGTGSERRGDGRDATAVPSPPGAVSARRSVGERPRPATAAQARARRSPAEPAPSMLMASVGDVVSASTQLSCAPPPTSNACGATRSLGSPRAVPGRRPPRRRPGRSSQKRLPRCRTVVSSSRRRRFSEAWPEPAEPLAASIRVFSRPATNAGAGRGCGCESGAASQSEGRRSSTTSCVSGRASGATPSSAARWVTVW